MIGIVDYKAGNSHSVLNACEKLGIKSTLISGKEEFDNVNAVILPGVGSAGATMDSLNELNIVKALEKRVLEDKIPFLGICVGLQIIFEHSEEGNVDCLGWLKGQVRRFNPTKVRVPQIGWNKLEWKKNDLIIKGLSNDKYFYFVNSYYAVPKDEGDILAVADYGHEFTAMIAHNNIYASQCHVEKSGDTGLRVLANFAEIGGQ